MKSSEDGSIDKIKEKIMQKYGYTTGGSAIGNYGTTNKLFNEEKFHAKQGHGFAAERANCLYDKLHGHDSVIVGDNNAKNGPDRIVDGVEIQSKYCAKGSRCINECFEDGGKGKFRYYTKSGKPMEIEVPSDKYDGAVMAMEEKIRRGQVNGVSDPSEAKNIVRKGHFTYEQAKNIAKAGTVESLKYDAINGTVIAGSALGVTAILTFASAIWNGDDPEIALKAATYSGLRVGGTAFVTSVLASQLSRAGLNSALVSSSEAVIDVLGPKASAVMVNAFRSGSNIYGGAAMKSAAKLLRGNVIASGITVAVLSSADIINIFRKRISGKQLFKNMTNTATTVVGGTAGWLGGAALGSMIVPGFGSVVGGLIGSVGIGGVSGKVSDKVLSTFVEDDADAMVKIIEEQFRLLAVDYLLNQNEAEDVVEELKAVLDGKILKNMYASKDRKQFAESLLLPLIESKVLSRDKVYLPQRYKIEHSVVNVIKELEENYVAGY